ncbi:Forkhead-associated (FHA) domain-containing protein [Cynara cardunculus var. scolymus]|uniref:Forkhead-associated (FHA) domain-containing protein n=1 Tax=Cynara cardunculus var. scolymus TaxID=59895 RepID=A0A124SDT4_CYNCS|nr:Forkhead-associated (FHA) domain-containing protein [Cynara cardunculus var. scolymus]
MEIESKTGFKTRLHERSESFDFGRESGFNPTDRTVSRRHISFKLHEDRTRVYFQVEGKNPVWVHDSINDEIRVYKTSEGGEMKSGDSFCVSSKNPIWFNLKKIASEEDDDDKSKSELRFDDVLAETSGSGIDYGEIDIGGDVPQIDPVKEFNFVVMGHEFDYYPKKLIRDIRNWDWFLEEPKEKSDDDDSERKTKKGTRKRKKGGRKDNDDDDVWTGESEEDAEMIKKLKNNQKKNKKDAGASTSTKYAKDEDDDEDDETLGGFIVDDDETREEDDDDEEEEEEFEEDEYDDE